jgi:hypothetical protein
MLLEPEKSPAITSRIHGQTQRWFNKEQSLKSFRPLKTSELNQSDFKNKEAFFTHRKLSNIEIEENHYDVNLGVEVLKDGRKSMQSKGS